MSFSFKEIEEQLRLLIPQFVLFVFLLLHLIVLPVPHADVMKPQFLLMGIYYWAIYRPTAVSTPFCFLLGFVTDILTGAIPGLHALLFVILQWIIRDQRRFLMGQPYVALWAVFGVVAFAAAFMQWALMSLSAMAWIPVMPVLINSVVSALAFPVVTILLVQAHRLLPVASKGYH